MNYRDKVKKYIKEMDKCRLDDSEKELALARKVYSIAYEKDEDDLKLMANYYLADAYISFGKMSECMKHSRKTIQLCERLDNEKFLMKIYIIIGNAFTMMYDEQSAIEYYLKCLNIVEKSGKSDDEDYHKMALYVYANIGNLYLLLMGYDKCSYYCDKALQMEKFRYESNEVTYIQAVLLINKALSCLHKKDYIEAEKILKHVDSNLSEEYYENLMPTIKRGLTYVCYVIGDKAKVYDMAIETLKWVKRCPDKLDILDDVFEISYLFLELGEYDRLEDTLLYIRELCEEVAKALYWIKYYDIKIKYYTKIGDTKNLTKVYNKYFYACKNKENEDQASRLKSIKCKIKLENLKAQNEKIRSENIELRHMSEHDELTGLNNRKVFDIQIERIFKKAQKYGKNFGLVMIDIDQFKQYNDHYGHLAGDKCIQMVADVIKENLQNKYYAARYGGDEIFIIIYNEKDDNIKRFSEKIRNEIESKNIEHIHNRYGHVTISQGIVNYTPRVTDRIGDYIHRVDSALYGSKRDGRNTITFSIIE